MLAFSKYLLFFLLCLALALVLNLPLPHLLPHLQLPPGVGLYGVDGTLLHGRVEEARIERFPLRDLRYRFEASCLPRLKVCYGLEYPQGTARVAYDLLNGDTEVAGADVEYAAAELTPYLPPLLLQPTGRLQLLVGELRIIDGQPAALDAELVWRGLGAEGGSEPVNLGDYRLTLTGAAPVYEFKLVDVDAALDVDGKGDLVAGGVYNLDIKITSNDTIDPQIRNVLDLFATKVSYNNYRVERRGRLPPQLAQMLPL